MNLNTRKRIWAEVNPNSNIGKDLKQAKVDFAKPDSDAKGIYRFDTDLKAS